jgi:quercetin 2,3-dioxygenase
VTGSVQVITPREVPLGGPRAMTVRRTLPARERPFVGAWCFVDHYGPDDVAESGGMDVAPHPHCALATVSWLFSGEVEHRDSIGTHAVVRPGEVNLMTAGRGISHSEVSTPATTVLHGAQLWLVLPERSAGIEPRFEHHVPEAVTPAPGVEARVFVGSMFGSASPVRVESRLVGAEIVLAPGAAVSLPLPENFEVAVLVDSGSVTFGGRPLARADLGVLGVLDHLGTVLLVAGGEGARVLVLGGEPFAEQVVMWWNFIGRTHEDVVAARAAWEGSADDSPFGTVEGYAGTPARIPAPPLPGVRLRPRGNRRTVRPAPAFNGTEAPPVS